MNSSLPWTNDCYYIINYPLFSCHSYEEQPDTMFMDEVELGALYELVITTASGFFRYRFGDVIKVVDYYNNCPVVEFMYR